MITICNGIVRSGSTWSYNVWRLIGQYAASSQELMLIAGYMSDTMLDKYLANEMTSAPRPSVIKAYELGPFALEWIRTGRAKAICTLRDPRDCVASDMEFMNEGMDYSIKRVQENLNSQAFAESFGRTLFVRYEEMMANPLWQIAQIATHMAVKLPPDAIGAIDQATNIEASRKICLDLKNRPTDHVNIINNHLIDKAFQLHANHINSGKIGRWKDELSSEPTQKLNRLFDPWLINLGYETEQSHAASASRVRSQAGSRPKRK